MTVCVRIIPSHWLPAAWVGGLQRFTQTSSTHKHTERAHIAADEGEMGGTNSITTAGLYLNGLWLAVVSRCSIGSDSKWATVISFSFFSSFHLRFSAVLIVFSIALFFFSLIGGYSFFSLSNHSSFRFLFSKAVTKRELLASSRLMAIYTITRRLTVFYI